jgi:hypothetical protein
MRGIALLFGLVTAQNCPWVQLGGPGPCVYSTSNCTAGVIQWNYPTDSCQWTFAPKGASSLLLQATWRTAADVNVSFFDRPNGNLLETVVGGDADDASATVVSSTGSLFVRLRGPPSMLTYALIFTYLLTLNPAGCAMYSGDCQACLDVGCSMVGKVCEPQCPNDARCWGPNKGTSNTVVCAARQTFIDHRTLCAARTTCGACTAGNVCKWGGPIGETPSCSVDCAPSKKCEFTSSCGQRPESRPERCENRTNCEDCLAAGCEVSGLYQLTCTPKCYSDTPCFSPRGSNCAARRALFEKTKLCRSLSGDCTSCLANQCQWNALAAPGSNCVTDCGFAPCQRVTQCLGPDVPLPVQGKGPQDSAGSASYSWVAMMTPLWWLVMRM